MLYRLKHGSTKHIVSCNNSPAAKVAVVNLASTAFPVETEDIAALVDVEAFVGCFADFVRGPACGGVLSCADEGFAVGFSAKCKSLLFGHDDFFFQVGESC